VKGLCTVVLWGQPSQPNGEIKRFDVQFYVHGRSYGTVIAKGRDNIYHIVEGDEKPSGSRDNEVSVGVSELHTVTIKVCMWCSMQGCIRGGGLVVLHLQDLGISFEVSGRDSRIVEVVVYQLIEL